MAEIVGQSEAPSPAPASAPAPHHDRFVAHANLMSLLTVLSRLFGLVRDKLCAVYLGNKTTEWSAFWMGFQAPNLFRRIFGEGALTAIFVPTYTRVLHEKGQAEASRLAAATATLLVTVLAAFTLLGELIVIPLALSPQITPNNRLAAAMIALMLPYCMMVCLVALLGAMATVHEKFTAQSLSPIILNVFMALAAALPVWLFSKSYPLHQRIYWVAGAVLIAGLLQVLQMLPTLRRAGVALRPLLTFRDPALREIIRTMLPMILGLSAVQFNTYMDTQIVWWLSPDGYTPKGMPPVHDILAFGRQFHLPLDVGAVGVLSVAQRLYLLPVGIFGVSMATAIFPLLSKAAIHNDTTELKRLLIAGLRKTLFISLPASVGMILIAPDLITVIYSPQDVDRSAWAAVWFCAGIWAFEGQMVLLRVFYALSDRLTPMKVAVAMVLLNFSLNITLVWFLREGGIALATTLSAIAQSAVLLFILRRRLGALGLRRLAGFIAKGLLACLIMAAAVLLTAHLLAHLRLPNANPSTEKLLRALIDLPIIIAAAAIVYAGMACLLKMPEIKEIPLVGRMVHRFSKQPPS